jgi:pyruvate dehydrogenase E2 component (dihydrolipoamide acetyltransferase)
VVVRDHRVIPRTCAEMTLTADHRILHGADAAAFLRTIQALLERPLGLLT